MYSLILTHSLLRLLDHLFYDSVVDPLGLAVHALADVSASQQTLIRCGGEERSLVEVGAGRLFRAPPVPGACTRTHLRHPCRMKSFRPAIQRKNQPITQIRYRYKPPIGM